MSISQKFLNKLIAILLIIPLLIPILPQRTTYADDKIIYLGGSANGGSGVVGNWTISMPGKATALKVSVDVRKKGDFADTGYMNYYPIADNYMILVPSNGCKTKSILTTVDGKTSKISSVSI